MQISLYVPVKGSRLLQMFLKFSWLNVRGLIMFKTFAPKLSCRLAFQFQGISVQFPAIYHVEGINKKENGNTFTLAKTFSFRWRKSYWMNNIRKMIWGLQKQKNYLQSQWVKPAFISCEMQISTRYTAEIFYAPAQSHRPRHTKGSLQGPALFTKHSEKVGIIETGW